MEEQSSKWKRLFLPVNGNYLFIILTAIYLFVLIFFYQTLRVIMFNPFEFKTNYLFYILSLGNLMGLLLAIVLAFIIHKTFWKGFLLGLGGLILFGVWGFLVSKGGESRGYFILALNFYFFILIGTCLLAYGLRSIFNIQSKKIKILLLIIPILIMIILSSIYLIKANAPGVGYCDSLKLKRQTSSADDCYNKVALEENNYALCFNIAGDSDRVYRCFDEVTNKDISGLDPTKCDTLEEHQGVCRWKVASLKNDITVCGDIKDYYLQRNCRTELGKNEKKNVEVCEILGSISRNDCYTNIAKATKNVSVCNLIRAGREKEEIVSEGDVQYYKDECIKAVQGV